MRILFLTTRLPHSDVPGGHRLVYQRMRQLSAFGHEVGLASFVQPENVIHIPSLKIDFFEVETVPIITRSLAVRMFHDYVSIAVPAIFWKNYSREMLRLVGDMVDRSGYDMVIAEYGEMGMYLYRNPYLSAVRKIVSCHRCLTTSFSKYVQTSGVPTMLRLKSASQLRVLEKFEFEMYRTMDHILTLTEEDRFTLLNYAPQLPVSIIPPGIDFDYLDRPPIDKSTHPVVIMCGYFSDKSNHDGAKWFIDTVWPLLSEKQPTLECQFVGTGATPAMRQAAKNDSRITVTGTVDDLRPYREKATVFINPMRLGSGLRIKVLEAMATSLPVVSTSLGVAGIPALNGTNCFIADDPTLFCNSINWLINDSNLAEQMGRNAKNMVKEKYNILTAGHELERIISDVHHAS